MQTYLRETPLDFYHLPNLSHGGQASDLEIMVCLF